MATTTVMKVEVRGLTKYGFQLPDGKYMSLSKHLPEAAKAFLVPGAQFDAEVYVSDKGTMYLNKIIGGEVKTTPATPPAPVAKTAPVVDEARAKRFTPKGLVGGKADSMSKEEWAAKDVRISRQGVIQAAVQALAPVVPVEELFKQSATLADSMLEYVNKK